MNAPVLLRHLSIWSVTLSFHLLILLAGFHPAAFGQEGVPPLLTKDLVEAAIERYNEHMTVQELIDIVMFLQPEYDVVMPPVNYRGHR